MYKQDKIAKDVKRDYLRSLEDYRSGCLMYEESKGHRTSLRRDGHGLKEAYKNDAMEVDGQRSAEEERRKL